MGKGFKEGTEVQFHPVSSFFLKRAHSNTVLVGDDPVQLRFVEQFMGTECVTKEPVVDDDLLGRENMLFHVLVPQSIRLTPQVRNHTNIFSLSPMSPGSVGANTLVKAAAELLGGKFAPEQLNLASRHIGSAFQRNEIGDMRIAFWRAFWLLSGSMPPSRWAEPWEANEMKDWLPEGINVPARLWYLFKTLKTYVLMQTGCEAEAKALGLSPSKLWKLKNLHLNPAKVRVSLIELSRWTQFRTPPEITALTLTAIWLS